VAPVSLPVMLIVVEKLNQAHLPLLLH